MTRIEKVGEGAYFVPSYSEQTTVAFQPGITTQTVVAAREDVQPEIVQGRRRGKEDRAAEAIKEGQTKLKC